MVTAFMPPCWASTSVRWTKRSPATVTGSAAALDAGADLALESGAETRVPAAEPGGGAGEPSELGAELLLGFTVSPAACLHRSDSESLCPLRQATIRPPPGCTPAHSFFASSAQAA